MPIHNASFLKNYCKRWIRRRQTSSPTVPKSSAMRWKEELTGYLNNMLDTEKSVYEKVIYESGTEAGFAEQLEKNNDVRVYAKLPAWSTIPTPLGSYNPDWAVLVEQDEGERLYLVVETKGSLSDYDLRVTEIAKIECGKAYINALEVAEAPAQYRIARSVDDLLAGSL